MPTSRDDLVRAVEVLQGGVSAVDLGVLFGVSATHVRARVSSLTAVGKIGQTQLYDFREAVGMLADIPEEVIEERFRSMTATTLPARLQKDFWMAQGLRLRYELERKRMWRTPRVQAMAMDVLRLVRQSVLLFPDAVEMRTAVTDEQRKELVGLADELLAAIHKSVTEHFRNYKEDGDHDLLDMSGPGVADYDDL